MGLCSTTMPTTAAYDSRNPISNRLFGLTQSKMNADQMGSTNNQMPGMKFMMTWMMPIMLLFMFNSFSAGLNYYYFLANLITLLQTFVIRQLIDDEKVLAKLHAHAQKAAPPTKSKWQQRLEQMQRQQQEMQRQRINKKR